ncbi:transcriptional regulator family: Fungal Specific TF [Paecilomyces variotii]|nr:transcriptional regulator family: Fungal Specific TF [Paecilomyces variotii]KAJ9379181.1 transcriptional regulator family: Fungal Specific TF [Paecilomyces variotii]KAJ9408278.1 transcriptional regulator family: Fungal Specific TF [Paecilomyces variotii]
MAENIDTEPHTNDTPITPARRGSQNAEKVTRACDNCSKSKSKCLLRPDSRTCENCKFLEVPCTFLRTVKKRGPPKGYVNTLEQRLSSLENIITGLQANAPRYGTPDSIGHRVKRQAREEDVQPAESNQRLVSASEVEDGRTERSTVLGYLSIDENMTMRYHGPTSGLHLITSSRIFASPFWQFANPGFWPRSKRTIFRTEDDIVSAADAVVGGILPNLHVQDKLLEAYWNHIHPSFPIIHRETFLFQLNKDRKKIPRMGRSALDQLERRIPQVLLLAMFSLSARFVESYEPQEDSDPGDAYATRAESLIAQHKQSTLHICLAILLMAYREIGTGGSSSWMYVGNAIRMAQDLGLHRDPSIWKNVACFKNMPLIEMQIRRSIWWGIFVLDRYISAWQGRPCGIHEDDFDTKLPEDILHGARDVYVTCFKEVIRLSLIQGRIHKAFYSVGTRPESQEKLKDFERDLDVWESQLPECLAVRHEPGIQIPVAVIALHAQFWSCKVLLHRPFLDISDEPRTNSSLFTATSAAVAISNLVQRFNSSYNANFAPPFLNYYVFTATIMHLFNRSMYPLLFSQAALTHCTDCCRMMSTIWSSAARTLHIIQGVDREVEDTLPVVSTSTSERTEMISNSWPSPIADPDWLSLETWRMDTNPSDEMIPTTRQYDRQRVIIVGAGLGGLACAMAMHHQGFEVLIFEKVREFFRLGDSLGLGENALKLLERWGLREQLVAIGNKNPNMNIRRWNDGKILVTQPLMDMAGYIGHRGDYHVCFIKRVEELGMTINMGHEVISYDEDAPSITLKDGRTFYADLIVGADGIKSRARELVLGFSDAPKSSGYACYRAFFKGDILRDVPECQPILNHDCVNIWIGEDMHLVQNTLRDGGEFNWIITHKDTEDIKESWFQPGNMDDVRSLVKDWDPTITSAINVTPNCLDWKICYRAPLPTWVSKSGKIALLGDSCHPHLPTSAQGTSQATESGAVLALCLALAGKGNVPLATRVYEKLRFDRVRQSQLSGEDLRNRWHNALKLLRDGEQLDPDDIKIKNRWLYPFDAEADTRDRWDEMSAKVKKELETGSVTPLFGDDGPPRVLTVRDAYGKVKPNVTEYSILPGLTV